MQLSKSFIATLSIRTKIILVIVIFVIFSLSAVGLFATYKGGEALSDQARENLELITQQKAAGYNAVFSRLQDEIEGIAEYAAQTFSRNMASSPDVGIQLLMPWNGSGYGSPEVKAQFPEEIRKLQYRRSGVRYP